MQCVILGRSEKTGNFAVQCVDTPRCFVFSGPMPASLEKMFQNKVSPSSIIYSYVCCRNGCKGRCGDPLCGGNSIASTNDPDLALKIIHL